MRKIEDLLQLELFQHGLRYVITGIWNTLFGLGCYTLLLIIFGQEQYLLLGVFSNFLAITNAFLCYKYFVFKTKGYFWQEYFKCYLVYGSGMLLGTVEMFVCVSIFDFDAIYSNFATTALNFFLSFLGHKYFSFRHKKRKSVLDIWEKEPEILRLSPKTGQLEKE